MDPDTKKFFEELTSTANEEKIIEPRVETAKASSALAKENKTNSKKNNKIEELMEEGEGQLAIDVYQTPDSIIVESTIAGVNPEDLDVDITSEAVTIKGKRIKEKIIEEENYFYQECYWGRFSRSIILPQEVDPDNSSASLRNGVLRIKLPKLDRRKTKKLKIKLS